MGKPCRYWIQMQLTASGSYRQKEHPAARGFFEQQFPQLAEQPAIEDRPVQSHLHLLRQTVDPTTSQLAELCLRCFISCQIVRVCDTLVSEFGKVYGFCLTDLLPIVLAQEAPLNDTDQPLTGKILNTFKPKSANLTTWTMRLVRQDKQLNQFLLEHGLYLLSDWAILNDTKPERLRRVFTEFYPLSAVEINRTIALLESYQSVYLADRLQQRQKGRCAAPDQGQLQRISRLLQEKTGEGWSAQKVLAQLQQLAERLRQHRLHIRGGLSSTDSLETPETLARVERLSEQTADVSDPSVDFLAAYRQEFQRSLALALKKVVDTRLQNSKKPGQSDRWLKALHLFYCQRMTMTAIAPLVQLRSQDNVSRLLKLKEFRADIRRHMLQQLQRYVLEEAKEYHSPAAIQALDSQIETALNEQIEALLEQAAKQATTPKEYLSGSIFSQKLCQYLASLLPLSPSESLCSFLQIDKNH